MNPLEAPYPVYLVRETEVVRNSLAEGLPLPQGDTLEVGTKTYQVVRLPAPISSPAWATAGPWRRPFPCSCRKPGPWGSLCP